MLAIAPGNRARGGKSAEATAEARAEAKAEAERKARLRKPPAKPHETVRPGYIHADVIIDYYLLGTNPENPTQHRIHRDDVDGYEPLKEQIFRTVCTIFDDGYFLYDCFKMLDEDGDGFLSEEQLKRWIFCLSTCAPCHESTLPPLERCHRCGPGTCKCCASAKSLGCQLRPCTRLTNMHACLLANPPSGSGSRPHTWRPTAPPTWQARYAARYPASHLEMLVVLTGAVCCSAVAVDTCELLHRGRR